MTLQKNMSVHGNVELANNSIPTFEEVYAIDYVRKSIECLLDKNIRQYPVLVNHKDDLRQEMLIHLNAQLPNYDGRASINTFCRICFETGLKMAKRKYFNRKNLTLFFAQNIDEFDNDGSSFMDDNDFKSFESLCRNNIEETMLAQDIQDIITNIQDKELKKISTMILMGHTLVKISQCINIPRSTIRYNQIPRLKQIFSKEISKKV